MNILYIDAFSGISGDMALGAFIDVGVPVDMLMAELGKLDIGEFELRTEKTRRGFLHATKMHVKPAAPDKEHRNLRTILSIIENAGLAARVVKRSVTVFRKLAIAESKVHDCGVDDVHFHEVGALDSIVDIVGFAVACEHLGIEKILSGPLRFGTGTVECQHGTIPVPAPATVELAIGFPVIFTGIERELTTPTGAAIVTALATPNSRPENFSVKSIGYGAGSAKGDGLPNVLRIFVGTSVKTQDSVVLLETNIDDMNPELLGAASEKLLAKGALDVFIMPVTMKKSRPGILLSVLANSADAEALEEIIFCETSTFGIRRTNVERTILERESMEIQTQYGPLSVKVGKYKGNTVTTSPEYESARALSERAGVPLKEIYRVASNFKPGMGE